MRAKSARLFDLMSLGVLVHCLLAVLPPDPVRAAAADADKEKKTTPQANPTDSQRAQQYKESGVILSLCRNSDADAMKAIIGSIQEKFNGEHGYDYVLINDVEFTEHFKSTVLEAIRAKGSPSIVPSVKFGVVPPIVWNRPKSVDPVKAEKSKWRLSRRDERPETIRNMEGELRKVRDELEAVRKRAGGVGKRLRILELEGKVESLKTEIALWKQWESDPPEKVISSYKEERKSRVDRRGVRREENAAAVKELRGLKGWDGADRWLSVSDDSDSDDLAQVEHRKRMERRMVEMERIKKKGPDVIMPYHKLDSYRNMCRFYSGAVYLHPLLKGYKYYWRIEPDAKYYCNANKIDPFREMRIRNKMYGFNIVMAEYMETIETLFSNVVGFLEKYRDIIRRPKDPLNFMFKLDKNGYIMDYNGCHFWTNFEIGDFDFFRSKEYRLFYKYLNKKGGFYYERWGDAPVHSIAVGLFMDGDKLIHFSNISYEHTGIKYCSEDGGRKLCKECEESPAQPSNAGYNICFLSYLYEFEERKKKVAPERPNMISNLTAVRIQGGGPPRKLLQNIQTN